MKYNFVSVEYVEVFRIQSCVAVETNTTCVHTVVRNGVITCQYKLVRLEKKICLKMRFCSCTMSKSERIHQW